MQLLYVCECGLRCFHLGVAQRACGLTVGLDGVVGVRWASPLSRVTFEPCQVLLWAWHGVKGEAMAVNEAEHTTGIVWKVRREERLRRCEVGVTVVGWCCHTHTGNEVSSCVGRVVERLPSLCVCFGPVDAVWF